MGTAQNARGSSLPSAPVELVVLAVEFPPTTISWEQMEAIRDALRSEFPLAERQVETRVEFFAGGSATPEQHSVEVLRLSTRDRRTVVQVGPERVVIETRRYDHFEWFTALVRTPLAVVQQLVRPDGINTIGHRFIDEVHLPAADGDSLDRWFDPAVLAMPNLVDGELPWQAAVTYQLTSESQLTLRYGPILTSLVPNLSAPPVRFDEPVFALDWDSQWRAIEAVPEFTAEDIISRVEEMYRPVRSLFQQVCTDELRQRFEQRVDKPSGAKRGEE